MESIACGTDHRNGNSGQVLTEEPVDTEAQEAIFKAREYDSTERCANGPFILKQKACSGAYMEVDSGTFSFVTGAGWIPNEEIVYSKAFFGFFCKKSGNSNPSGHMRFRWGENLFQVTEFDRLVVDDDTATFAGVGTINDIGEHDFMVHIRDKPNCIDILITGEDGYDTGGPVDLGSGRIKIRQWTEWLDILRNN